MFDKYLAAMNATRDRAALAAAVTDDIVIERHAGGDPGPLAQVYTGLAEVADWFARTPPRCVFALLGAPARGPDDTWRVGYSIAVDDFYNTGVWIARFAADGRVTHLWHQPHALKTDG